MRAALEQVLFSNKPQEKVFEVIKLFIIKHGKIAFDELINFIPDKENQNLWDAIVFYISREKDLIFHEKIIKNPLNFCYVYGRLNMSFEEASSIRSKFFTHYNNLHSIYAEIRGSFQIETLDQYKISDKTNLIYHLNGDPNSNFDNISYFIILFHIFAMLKGVHENSSAEKILVEKMNIVGNENYYETSEIIYYLICLFMNLDQNQQQGRLLETKKIVRCCVLLHLTESDYLNCLQPKALTIDVVERLITNLITPSSHAEIIHLIIAIFKASVFKIPIRELDVLADQVTGKLLCFLKLNQYHNSIKKFLLFCTKTMNLKYMSMQTFKRLVSSIDGGTTTTTLLSGICLNYLVHTGENSDSDFVKTTIEKLKLSLQKIDQNIEDLSPSLHTTNKKVPDQKIRHDVGILNIGNSCYMNSVLQILKLILPISIYFVELPPAQDMFLKAKSLQATNPAAGISLMKSLQKLFILLFLSKKSYINPLFFKNTLPLLYRDNYEQQDCTEFLKIYLDSLENSLKNLKMHNIFKETFLFTMNKIVACSGCNHNKVLGGDEIDISLPILTQEGIYINSVFEGCQKYLHSEPINNYECEFCNSLNSSKTLTKYFQSLPNILIINLNRFQWNSVEKKRIKVMHSVNIDQELIFQPSKDGYTVVDTNNNLVDDICFVLFGIIMHRGLTMDFGHYYSIGKNFDLNSTTWRVFDDSSVRSHHNNNLNPASGLIFDRPTDTPYVLFYVKKSLIEKFSNIKPSTEAPEIHRILMEEIQEINMSSYLTQMAQAVSNFKRPPDEDEDNNDGSSKKFDNNNHFIF